MWSPSFGAYGIRAFAALRERVLLACGWPDHGASLRRGDENPLSTGLDSAVGALGLRGWRPPDAERRPGPAPRSALGERMPRGTDVGG
jgi:hypothetical protein